jgi:purine-nucleoside phosphorylase
MSTAFAEFAALARQSPPLVAVVLGSGTNVVADCVIITGSIPFGDIPGLSAAAVAGHRGRLTLGDWAGRRVLVFEGRLHYYEGHSWDQVVRPVHVAHEFGARVLLATNAAGGIHPSLGPGDLMAVCEHLRWNVPRPWVQPERPSPYSPRLLAALNEAERFAKLGLKHGVYASLTGPCYETPAEIRALRACGADAVGMSTAREVEEAVSLGMECAAVSCITNQAAGQGQLPLDHHDVLTVAAAMAERVGRLIEGFLQIVG